VGPETVAAMTKEALAGSEVKGKMDNKSVDTLIDRGNFVEIVPQERSLPLVYIDGPYGAPTTDVFDNEVAVLIGAGIGTTLNSSY
jgi:NADPH oxidase 1